MSTSPMISRSGWDIVKLTMVAAVIPSGRPVARGIPRRLRSADAALQVTGFR